MLRYAGAGTVITSCGGRAMGAGDSVLVSNAGGGDATKDFSDSTGDTSQSTGENSDSVGEISDSAGDFSDTTGDGDFSDSVESTWGSTLVVQ